MANEQESDIIKDQPQGQDSQPLDSPTPTEEPISSNKRIAKNAIMLYIRMFLSMIVGLYTSRVVLNVLGVEDYGIYGIVGGVVAMMGFLNASMAGATSRFITFELGKGNIQRLKDTFSSALIIHIGIAIVIFILAETVGLWFLNNKLVIPENRLVAANWVYQMSILSAMLSITQVPYNACIIAHEKMTIYAYIEILNVTLRLIIVYLLVIGDFDKLILYAILTLVVSAIIMMTYRIYCIRKFQECHFHWIWNKEIICPLLSFSGWDLYGNMCATARPQGTNFLINIFFGVILNAASSIATTVSGVISGFSHNIIQAFRPQIIKQYAQNNIPQMQKLVENAITYTSLFMGCFVIIFLIEAEYILKLWLKDVPSYAVVFCQITLISNFLGLINAVICIVIHATGNIKKISIITGSVFLLNIPIVYVCFKLGLAPQWAYYTSVFTYILIIISNISIAKYQVANLHVSKIISKIIIVIIVLISVLISSYIISLQFNPNFVRLTILTLFTAILLSVITYIFFIDKETKNKINCRFKHIIYK